MRIRLAFSKQGALRYTGHLDLHRLWERALRRADLPIAYSQGFHPQPKISLASALPLGFASRAELVDVRLNQEIPLGEIAVRLKESLPPDLQILDITTIDEQAPALQTLVLSAHYEIHFIESVEPERLKQNAAALLLTETLIRERRGKTYDLRPLIEKLDLREDSNGEITLYMTLAARDGATGRPDEVLLCLNISPENTRVERTALILRD